MFERALTVVDLARKEIRQGRFQRVMAILTAFAAIVSGFEAYMQHQRGAFAHWLMWTPVGLTLPVSLTAGAALFSERIARSAMPVVSAISLLDGVAGFVYHIRGINRLPGGFKLGQYNIVMGPPIFAPLLLCSVGILGLFASYLRRERFGTLAELAATLPSVQLTPSRSGGFLQGLEFDIAHGRFQRSMVLASAFMAALSGGEVYFEHLRGSFCQRWMWLPIWVTPPMVGMALAAARSKHVARSVLPFASVATFSVGMTGFLLHLRGIRRMAGGVGNLRFDVTLGPPLFAPLLFTAAGLLGFIAVLLRRRD